MDYSIYRIFNAVGDSIMLSTLFKEKGIRRVFYNRGEFGVLNQIMEMYDVQPIEFIATNNPIQRTMVTVAHELFNDKIKLLKPSSFVKPTPEHTTYQLGSKNQSARDRNITYEEMSEHIVYDQYELIDTQQERYITGPLSTLFDLLGKSKHHITCDSGTAFISTSLGVETTIISKNSLYFNGSYFNMKYLHMHDHVMVYQEGVKGVRMPTQQQYETLSKQRCPVPVAPYDQYITSLIVNPR